MPASTSTDLRIALLGVGTMGAFHADALNRRIRGARVTVVSDFFADKASSMAERIGARVVADPIQAINADDVDAVLIATPGAAHDEQANACLDRGIPVLCEKPLTTDIASAYAIVQKEAALGRQLIQVGFMRRFDTEYMALKKLIADGALGNPLLVHCTHRAPAVPDVFNSASMMRDSVVHEVDVARFLLDEEITSVQVIKGLATRAAPVGTSDPMIVVFETESGRIVTDEIYVRTGVAYEVRTEVVGERGSAMIGLDQNLQVKTTDGRWGGQITPGFVERFGAAYDTELQRWVDAARSGTIDGPAAWDGYAAVAVCEAGVEAVRTGEKVMVRLDVKPGSVSRSVAEHPHSVRGQTEPAVRLDVKPGSVSRSVAEHPQSVRSQTEPAVRHPDTAEFDAELDAVEPSHHEPKVVDDSPDPGITAPDMEAAR